jgi:hypothetical protein
MLTNVNYFTLVQQLLWAWVFSLRVMITLGRISLDGWSARRKNLYLKTHNTHKRQTSMIPAGFEPTFPAYERPQTHALDHVAFGAGFLCI